MKTLTVLTLLALLLATPNKSAAQNNTLYFTFTLANSVVPSDLGMRYDRHLVKGHYSTYEEHWMAYGQVSVGRYDMGCNGSIEDIIRAASGFHWVTQPQRNGMRFTFGGGLVYHWFGESVEIPTGFLDPDALSPASFELGLTCTFPSRFVFALNMDWLRGEANIGLGLKF